MVKIIANQKLPYGGKNWTEGETLDVSDKDAKLLVGINRARLAPQETAPPAPLKAMTPPAPKPEPEQAQEAAPEAPAHPSTYHRRDLTAEPAGQTGPAKSPQSLRRGQARKAKT